MSRILKYRNETEQILEKIQEKFLNVGAVYFPRLKSIDDENAIFSSVFRYTTDIFSDSFYAKVTCRVPLTDRLLSGDGSHFMLTPTQALPFATFETNYSYIAGIQNKDRPLGFGRIEKPNAEDVIKEKIVKMIQELNSV